MKRLILCCDGTWNRADQARDGVACPTNVFKLAYRVAKRDEAHGVPQITYYRQGVGTGNWLDRLTGGAMGEGLEENIHDAYRFLIANYELGDEIFLFGFSRGAFTARSLGGMIRKCGIPKRTCLQSHLDALALYRSDVHPNDEQAKQFRAAHCMTGGKPIPIRFIGVWDTVGALGIPMRGLRWLTQRRHQFHDTELSGSVQTACHALAIDEHRSPFVPSLWQDVPKENQTIQQVWFPGAHSDVGGGYGPGGVADVSLQWMIDQAQQAGLVFDPEVSRLAPIPEVDPRAPIHNSKCGLYRFSIGVDRTIGIAKRRCKQSGRELSCEDATQDLHPYAKARWETQPSYRPRPLRDFLKRRDGSPAAAPPAEPTTSLYVEVIHRSPERPASDVPATPSHSKTR